MSEIKLKCSNCLTDLDSIGIDLVIPDQQWKAIAPEGFMLCPNCIARRAAKLGCTAILGWLDNLNYAKANTDERAIERAIERVLDRHSGAWKELAK